MKVFFKDAVFSDIEEFLSTYEWSELPIKAYADAKGFDVNLFREFLNKLSNWAYATSNEIDADNVSVNEIKSTLTAEELVWKKPWPQTRWNQNVVYFSLTEDDLTTYADFINYYTNLWMFSFENDPFRSVSNSKEVFEIYWNYQKKPMPEDEYLDQDRTLNFPYLIDTHQWSNRSATYNFLDIPERYHTEWYYAWIWSEAQKEINNQNLPERIWNLQSYSFWRLIPTSDETPYDDAISHMPYEYDQFHNHLSKELQRSSAIASNLIGDAYANLTVNPLQWK